MSTRGRSALMLVPSQEETVGTTGPASPASVSAPPDPEVTLPLEAAAPPPPVAPDVAPPVVPLSLPHAPSASMRIAAVPLVRSHEVRMKPPEGPHRGPVLGSLAPPSAGAVLILP